MCGYEGGVIPVKSEPSVWRLMNNCRKFIKFRCPTLASLLQHPANVIQFYA